jgi:hypothetical protein
MMRRGRRRILERGQSTSSPRDQQWLRLATICRSDQYTHNGEHRSKNIHRA